MKKKGFTLVELLAVIAILAILVIIALPNVLKMFRNAKEGTFVTEVQEIIKTAEQSYISGSLSNKDCKCFSNTSNPLDLNGRENIEYYVEFNNEGQIINLTVKDDSYQFVSEGEVIKIADIGSSTSGKSKITSPALESTEVPSCDGSSGVVAPKNNSMLKISSMGEQGVHFFSTIAANKIESMVFTNTNKVPNGVLGSEDVSEDEKGNIMMWWTDTDGNGLYEATVGQEGGVRANTKSSNLFYDMSSLTTLDLTYLYTADTTNMRMMFNGCSSLTTLNLSNFNTANVTDMFTMFENCSSLQTLDLSSFDTSKVTSMFYMFDGCSNLTSITYGDKFVINDDTNITGMFNNTDKLENDKFKSDPAYTDRFNGN